MPQLCNSGNNIFSVSQLLLWLEGCSSEIVQLKLQTSQSMQLFIDSSIFYLTNICWLIYAFPLVYNVVRYLYIDTYIYISTDLSCDECRRSVPLTRSSHYQSIPVKMSVCPVQLQAPPWVPKSAAFIYGLRGTVWRTSHKILFFLSKNNWFQHPKKSPQLHRTNIGTGKA